MTEQDKKATQSRLNAHVNGLWLLGKTQGGRVVIPANVVTQLPANPQVLVQSDAAGSPIVQAL